MNTDTLPPTTIDVTGLPPDVIAQLQQLVSAIRSTTTATADPPRPRQSLMGAYSHLKTGTMTEEDFRAYRREIWGVAPSPPPVPPTES